MNDETPNTELQVYEPPQNKAVSVFLDMRLFEDAQRVCKALHKSALKKAIANGENPPGCRLQTEEERGDSLRIR